MKKNIVIIILVSLLIVIFFSLIIFNLLKKNISLEGNSRHFTDSSTISNTSMSNSNKSTIEIIVAGSSNTNSIIENSNITTDKNILLDEKEKENSTPKLETELESSTSKELSNLEVNIVENSITPIGLTLDIIDHNENTFSYSDIYIISKLEDNNYKSLKRLIPLSGYDVDSIKFKKNTVNEVSLDWSKTYGKLSPGDYQIDWLLDGQHFYLKFQINE